MHAPVVVLGGGPGGYAAAFLAADEGLDVTVVEAESRLGVHACFAVASPARRFYTSQK